MRKVSLLAISTLLSVFALTQAQTFEIDPVHSSVGFSIRHIVSNVKGRFTDFGGIVIYDSKKIENSSVNVTIKADSIDTDNEKRDGHLRSPDFFEVEKYPEITFKSTRVVKKGKKYMVHGTFTMHGVSTEISFPFEILGVAQGPGGGARAGFEAELTLNRKDYGIVWNRTLDQGGLLLGDEVRIMLALEAVEKKQE
jgi:polyisoprenoid-binding protein YceI